VSELDFSTTQVTGKLTAEGIIESLEVLLYDHEETDVPPPIGPWFAGMRDYMTKYPTWSPVVEGSIARPITDEKRLLK
jgi:hypothetical protein